MKNQIPIRWKNRHIYVDIDTGEQITKHQADTKYKIIKTTRHAKITNASKTAGEAEHTHLCRNRAYQELPFND